MQSFIVVLGYLTTLSAIDGFTIITPWSSNDPLGTRPPHSFKNNYFPSYNSFSNLGEYQSAAVSTDAAPCAPIGREILLYGGSAVDAAIAVLTCMGVVHPQSMGIGGGFLMTVYRRKEGVVTFIDAREMAPLRADESMYKGNTNASKFGPLAVAVPGEVSGYELAHQLFGKLPWNVLFQPTIDLCRRGIPVMQPLADSLQETYNDIMSRHIIRRMFTSKRTGRLYEAGDVMRRPKLANTLESISKEGAKALYGPSKLSQKFVQDLKEMGSLIREDDLLTYKPRIREPISIPLNQNWTVYTSAPPGSGALLALMLNTLEGYNFSPKIGTDEYSTVLMLHRMVEAFKFAYAKRMEMEDYNERMKEVIRRLTSKRYASYVRSHIDDSTTYDDPSHYELEGEMPTSDHGTSHMVVIAENGDAVSVTSTINFLFGSLEVSKSTGIILNNEMDDFSVPETTSLFRVPSSRYNRIAPRRRPLSSMVPSIIVDPNGDVRLAIGASGGTMITTAVLQAIMYNLWLGRDIKQTIDAPRLHHQLFPNNLFYQPGFPENLLDGLRELGHNITQITGMTSVVNGAARGHDGMLTANADYRKYGDVAGY